MALWRMLDTPSPSEPTVTDLMSRTTPDIVVMALGYNDVAYGWGPAMDANVRRFVTEARESNPAVKVVLGDLPQEWVAGVTAYDRALPALAADLSTDASPVVATDVTPDFRQGVDTYDTAHPTDSGQAKIAAAVVQALARLGVATVTPSPLPPLTPAVTTPPPTTPPPTTPPPITPAPTTLAPTTTPPAPALAAPAAPTLRAKAARRGWVTITWSPVATSTGTRVFFRDQTARAGWTVRYVDTETGVAYLRQRFVTGHRVQFRAQAVNAAGVSPFSHVVRIRTR